MINVLDPPPEEAVGSRVMLVDDDEDIRTVLAEALQDGGYEVRAVASGREALAQLHAGYAPALILLDLMMPVMDGWQFREEQLQDAKLKSIPVVVISAVNPGKALPPGTALLRKPFDLEAMFAEVARAIGGAT
jgi:CheY-like chemotaxis protein